MRTDSASKTPLTAHSKWGGESNVSQMLRKNMFVPRIPGRRDEHNSSYGKIPLQCCQGQRNLGLSEMYTLITFMALLGLWVCFDRFHLSFFLFLNPVASASENTVFHPPTFIPSLRFLSFSKGGFRKCKSND